MLTTFNGSARLGPLQEDHKVSKYSQTRTLQHYRRRVAGIFGGRESELFQTKLWPNPSFSQVRQNQDLSQIKLKIMTVEEGIFGDAVDFSGKGFEYDDCSEGIIFPFNYDYLSLFNDSSSWFHLRTVSRWCSLFNQSSRVSRQTNRENRTRWSTAGGRWGKLKWSCKRRVFDIEYRGCHHGNLVDLFNVVNSMDDVYTVWWGYIVLIVYTGPLRSTLEEITLRNNWNAHKSQHKRQRIIPDCSGRLLVPLANNLSSIQGSARIESLPWFLSITTQAETLGFYTRKYTKVARYWEMDDHGGTCDEQQCSRQYSLPKNNLLEGTPPSRGKSLQLEWALHIRKRNNVKCVYKLFPTVLKTVVK